MRLLVIFSGRGSGDTSSEARVFLFGAATSMFADHPMIGVGTSGFQALNTQVLGPSAVGEYPHNALLQIGADHGLLGIIVFLTLVVLALTRPLPRGTDGTVVRVLFIFFLFNAMVSGNVYEDRNMWGMMLLVLLMDVSRLTRPAPTLPAVTIGTSRMTGWIHRGGRDLPVGSDTMTPEQLRRRLDGERAN